MRDGVCSKSVGRTLFTDPRLELRLGAATADVSVSDKGDAGQPRGVFSPSTMFHSDGIVLLENCKECSQVGRV